MGIKKRHECLLAQDISSKEKTALRDIAIAGDISPKNGISDA